jgi:DNA invertase Pin-like site-specific DNA recombinase
MDIVPYYRTSTKDQHLGIDAQHATLDRIAGQRGCRLLRAFTEHESGGNCERVELDRAIKYARRAGAILGVGKLDRLARDSQFLMKLVDSDVPILFGDLPEVDGSAASRLMVQTMANFAEFERRRIGERIKEALAAYKANKRLSKATLRDYPNGVPAEIVEATAGKLGASLPKCRKLTADQRVKGALNSAKASRAKAIEQMSDIAGTASKLRSAGLTLQAIADRLNEAGESTRKGSAWNAVQVKRVLDRLKPNQERVAC